MDEEQKERFIVVGLEKINPDIDFKQSEAHIFPLYGGAIRGKSGLYEVMIKLPKGWQIKKVGKVPHTCIHDDDTVQDGVQTVLGYDDYTAYEIRYQKLEDECIAREAQKSKLIKFVDWIRSHNIKLKPICIEKKKI